MKTPIPKYFLVKSIIDARLEREFARGSRLPSEIELCRAFKVSRITIQQALSLIEKEGTIRREQGRGTFYLGPRVKRTETKPSELLESVIKHREGAYTRVVNKRVIAATPRIAERLRLAPESLVVAIDRVGIVDHEPIIFIMAYLPHELGVKVLADESALTRSTLGSLLQDKYAIQIDSVLQTIGATLADPAFADHLGVEIGAPVLEGERTYFDTQGRPIIFSDAFYRADRHRFVVTLKEWR